MLKKSIIILSLICLITSLGYSAFRNMNLNTRARGMGNAYTALSDDAGAMCYNIAGLAKQKSIEANFLYSKLYKDLDTVDLSVSYGGIVMPVKFGSFGLDWSKFNAEDLYYENVLNFAFAKNISDKISLGLGVSQLSNGYTLDSYSSSDPVFSNGTTKTAYSANAGLMLSLQTSYEDNFYFGLSAKNINKPDIGLKTKDIVAPEYRAGIAFDVKEFWLGNFFSLGHIIPSLDFSYRDQTWGDNRQKTNFYEGIEAKFFQDKTSLRLGNNETEFTFGLGLYLKSLVGKKLDLGLDYAFGLPKQIKESSGNHQLSLTIRYSK